MILIRKNNQNKVSNNFKESEYFSKSFGFYGKSFYYSSNVIKGAQIIRDYFNQPMRVNASYRTSQHDKSKGRSGTGTHTKGLAGDFSFLNKEYLYLYNEEILEKGKLYQLLRKAGINGFGLYDNFLHIDGRDGGNQKDTKNGSFAFWDRRVTSKKKA